MSDAKQYEIGRDPFAPRSRWSVGAAAAAHAILIVAVLTLVTSQEVRTVTQDLVVRLIQDEPPKVQPTPPKPLPAQPQTARAPAPPPPVMTAAAEAPAPSSFTVAPQPVRPAPTEIAPVSVTAARFDADYLHNPKPVYPSASRRLGEQGRVLLRVFVSADGQAERVEIRTSSGFPRLDQAAEDAVARWRFVPARRGDQAVAAWVQVPITFQLES